MTSANSPNSVSNSSTKSNITDNQAPDILKKIVKQKHVELAKLTSFDEMFKSYCFNLNQTTQSHNHNCDQALVIANILTQASKYQQFKIEQSILPSFKFEKVISNTNSAVLIAEIKKASPSKGIIRNNFEPKFIAQEYTHGGAKLISVLTDEEFFQGSLNYLKDISNLNLLPCLRKDFIIDKRQIIQAKVNGADAVLLIQAILSTNEVNELSSFAKALNLDVLLEVHTEDELKDALKSSCKLIGINNRNLKTFKTTLNTSLDLMSKYQKELAGRLIVSESGINNHNDIRLLFNAGAKAFLVGESLMRQNDIQSAVKNLMNP